MVVPGSAPPFPVKCLLHAKPCGCQTNIIVKYSAAPVSTSDLSGGSVVRAGMKSPRRPGGRCTSAGVTAEIQVGNRSSHPERLHFPCVESGSSSFHTTDGRDRALERSLTPPVLLLGLLGTFQSLLCVFLSPCSFFALPFSSRELPENQAPPTRRL